MDAGHVSESLFGDLNQVQFGENTGHVGTAGSFWSFFGQWFS